MLLEPPASILSRFADNLPLLQTVLVSFREETERQLEQLQQARDDGDLRGVLAALHGIKGSTGTMGARALSHLAMELESRGRGLTPDTAAPFLEDPSWLLQMRALLVESNQQLLEQFQVDASTGQGQEPLPALDEDAWREVLQQTLELLASGSIQALDRARELKGRARIACGRRQLPLPRGWSVWTSRAPRPWPVTCCPVIRRLRRTEGYRA